MDATIQFVPMLIVGFALSLGLTPVSRHIAMRLGVVDKPAQRKIHQDHKPLMGGLAIYVGFALALLVFSPPQHIVEFGAIVCGAGVLSLTGLMDDRYNLSVRVRLFLMLLSAVVVAVVGIQIHFFGIPLLDFALTVFWLIALINALNFLDNMDGLSAGVAAIASFFFLIIAIANGQSLVSMLAAALFGSALGFLIYNFNPASTFMGDMGALVLGFVLAVLSIKLALADPPPDARWLAPIFVLGVPIFDINLVVWTRLWEGRSPAQAGKDHTSHRLMSLGLTQRQTLLIMYSLCALFGFLGLMITASPPTEALFFGGVGALMALVLSVAMVLIRQRVQKRLG